MSLILVLSLQAAAVATPAAPAPPPASGPGWAMPVGGGDRLLAEFSPARATGADRCAAAAVADILVCGPRRGDGGGYPMAYWARIYGPEPPIRAEMGLGGGAQGRIYTEAVAMPRGEVSHRVMVGIRWPF